MPTLPSSHRPDTPLIRHESELFFDADSQCAARQSAARQFQAANPSRRSRARPISAIPPGCPISKTSRSIRRCSRSVHALVSHLCNWIDHGILTTALRRSTRPASAVSRFVAVYMAGAPVSSGQPALPQDTCARSDPRHTLPQRKRNLHRSPRIPHHQQSRRIRRKDRAIGWRSPHAVSAARVAEQLALPELRGAISHLKDWRRVATRYDKLARNFRATVSLALLFRWWI